ncbi:MAG: hypothetical protein ACPF9D_05210 [Owenweeksia sp.]
MASHTTAFAQQTFLETFLYPSCWPGQVVAFDSIAFMTDTSANARLTRAIWLKSFKVGGIDSANVYYGNKLSAVYDGSMRGSTNEIKFYHFSADGSLSPDGRYDIDPEKDGLLKKLTIHSHGKRGFSQDVSLALHYNAFGMTTGVSIEETDEKLPEPIPIMAYYTTGQRVDSVKTLAPELDLDIRFNLHNFYEGEKLVGAEMITSDGGNSCFMMLLEYNKHNRISGVLRYEWNTLKGSWELEEYWRYFNSVGR